MRINAITPVVALVVANSLLGFPPPLRDVTAWQETAGDQMIVHFEVYDPVREVTQHGQSAPIFGVSNLQAHDGVVSWKAHYGGATSDQAKFVLFDPVRGSWRQGSSSLGDSVGPIVSDGGALAWVRFNSGDHNRESATFDPRSTFPWVLNSQVSIDPGDDLLYEGALAANNGVVAYNTISLSGYLFLMCRAYDPLANGWTTDDVSLSGPYSEVTYSLSILCDSVDLYVAGFGVASRAYPYAPIEWPLGQTEAQAYFYAEPIPDSPAHMVFWNMSLGGTSFTWDFGDGFSSVEPSPVHRYERKGKYTATLQLNAVDGCGGTDEYTNEVDACAFCPPVIYVDSLAAPGGDGTSSDTAFRFL